MGMSIREMEATINKLQLQLNKEKEDKAAIQAFYGEAKEATDKLVIKFRTFCNKILEKDLTTGELNPPDLQRMSLPELLDAAEKSYKKELDRNMKHFISFADKLQEKKLMIDSLMIQVSQLQHKLASCNNTDALDDPSDDPSVQAAPVNISGGTEPEQPKAVTHTAEVEKHAKVDDFAKALSRESAEAQKSQKPGKKERTIDISPQIVAQDLRVIERDMDAISWGIMKAIGKYGHSEFSDIEKQLLLDSVGLSGAKKSVATSNPKKDKKPGQTKVREKLKILRDSGILECTKVETGFRWFFVHKLTSIGELLYQNHFKSKPVVPEMERLCGENKSYVHGYAIKDASAIFETKFDFTSVSIDRKKNYIKLPNGKASIPDVICTNDETTIYVEVECGNHTQEDFNEKCDKLLLLTGDIYFVTPHLDYLNTIDRQIENWIAYRGGRKALKTSNVTVYLSTLATLNVKRNVYIYSMDKEERIDAKDLDSFKF